MPATSDRPPQKRSGTGQRPDRGKGKPPAGKGRPPAGKGRPPAGKGRPPAGKGGAPARGARPDRIDRAERTDRDPRIPDDIHLDDLDPGVLNELRTLPEGLAEMVGRHLLAAEAALLEDDVDRAAAHVQAAHRRAARVSAVREAAGFVAYRQGEYAKALNEFRAVRRMTGNDAFIPILADCERGLGRPERALDLLKELRGAPPEVRIEGLIVGAGARADLGQLDAGIVMLRVPELEGDFDPEMQSRLQYAYADLLERSGEVEQARAWFAKAAALDTAELTDAAERAG